ncbi:TonB-dependent receptor [Pseudomaricurvus alcaniphilus]|uniref:TonB-dependent receptor n=1 Tax=Pseudomaricurvus alcaniphilus TaxID=1166482 RepID=UPI00140993E8|nr:TonB-dependent receptor [Pseudomaricurvus alcaniphilus]NHN38255.1 TonB-dependent receptor [Pseudomaricurvus alcaniphilus]
MQNRKLLPVLHLCAAIAASAPAAAADNRHQDYQVNQRHSIEEVTVNARKVEESLQDIPLAVTAFNAEQLKNQGVTNIAELQYQVPSLVFSQTATSSFSPLVSMRGQTQGTIAISVDPSVGVYVDDVYLSGTAGLMGNALLDLQQVEVLKGPQGTLFGRNTTGGAVSLATRLPTRELEGEITAGAGNYGSHNLHGLVNIPLIDDILAVRLVAGNSSRDGYGRDRERDTDVGAQKIKTLRGTLLYTPNDAFTAVLRADAVDGDDNGLLTRLVYIDPNVARGSLMEGSINLSGENTAAGQAAALQHLQDRINSNPFEVAYNTDVYSKIDTENYSLTMSYDFGDVQLKSITATRETLDSRLYEVDTTDIINFAAQTDIELDQLTQELQVTGAAFKQQMNYVAGLYYYELDGTEHGFTRQFTNLTNGQYQVTQAHLETRSEAAYGQVTYNLTDALRLTGGLRYTHERKVINALGGSGSNVAPFTCSLPLALNPDLVACNVKVPNSENNLSYLLAADYDLSDNTLVYFRTARGYKSGGVNQRIIGNSPLAGNRLLPEKVTDFEVGLKADLLAQRLRTNIAYYRSLYKDIQRSAVACTGTQCSSVLFNAASATIDGLEIEVRALLADNFDLGFTAAYTKPEYDSFTSGGIDNSAENFLEVPEWTYSLSAAYTQALAFGELHLQLDWSWRAEMDMAPQDYPGGIRLVGGVPTANGPGTPDDIRIQPEYGLLNANISLKLDEPNLEIRAYGKNLLDEEYYSHALGNVNAGLGLSIATPGNPTTFGVDLTLRF